MDIPGYKIKKLIAEGGMADVYLATQESLQRRVALKLLKKFDKPEQSDRFINEGRIIASLYHTNIITIHDIGKVGEQHYISMEYLEGGDLERRIRQGMQPGEALDIVVTIGSCLELVHSKGIVHRDIKPANILFRKDQTAVLTDFGIAKQLNQDTKLTMDGTAMGSPDYLSPEQAACKELDGRADIYSLGIVFYEMLTGQKPYNGDSYIEAVMAHISAPIPTLPADLERYQILLERMIAKEPDDRFASVVEMITYIEEYVRPTEGRGIWAKMLRMLRRLRRKKEQEPEEDSTGPDKTVVFTTDEIDAAMHDTPMPGTSHGSLHRGIKWGAVLLVFALTTLWVVDQRHIPDPPAARAPVEKLPEVVVDKSPPVEKVPPNLAEAFPEDDEPLFIEPSVPVVTTNKEVTTYLDKAQRALDAYKLTQPKNDNAYFYFKKVLKLEPGHKQAKQGMVHIADRYALLAEREIDRYDYDKAKYYVNTGLRVQPGHKKLLALSKRTSAVKDIPGRLLDSLESIFE